MSIVFCFFVFFWCTDQHSTDPKDM